MIRERWVDLSGVWRFAFDDYSVGLDEHWELSEDVFRESIVVPFPPESKASGIGQTGRHNVFWYRREISSEEIRRSGFRDRDRLLIHFGAVDYSCSVWLNGIVVGIHEGGHTPFACEVQLSLLDGPQILVVRAEDRVDDVEQPRGKQDWLEAPHSVWYNRTSGIWQPVWLEAVPATYLQQVHWSPDIDARAVLFEGRSNEPVSEGARCRVRIRLGNRALADIDFAVTGQSFRQVISLAALDNGQGFEDMLWSPETPVLIDSEVELATSASDVVASYFGLRTVTVEDGEFLLNGRPYFLRAVLSQGYWPESHLAAPSPESLRAEVELIRGLGFNCARVHQKIEDPRFIYWADRLGLALWGEAPAAYSFSVTSMRRTTDEWMAALDRDRSHPSILLWVPLNESWGVQQIRHDGAQSSFARSLLHLTHAIDPTRPVISNDGWEHVDSDAISVHDYESDPQILRERYGPSSKKLAYDSIGPSGRRTVLTGVVPSLLPFFISEFGGISFPVDESKSDQWGYSEASDATDFETRLTSILEALRESTWVSGICYTQLTDTMQETNGLATANRTPKLAEEHIRHIVLGSG